jgi:riboflavin synthase
VDSTATIIERVSDGDSVRLTFQLEEATLLPYLIPKGYVALDGVSLTLTGVDDAQRRFGIMLIKHTQERVTVGGKGVGEKVNVEVDMVGKYVYKSVTSALGGEGSGGLRQLVERVVEDVLRR